MNLIHNSIGIMDIEDQSQDSSFMMEEEEGEEITEVWGNVEVFCIG